MSLDLNEFSDFSNIDRKRVNSQTTPNQEHNLASLRRAKMMRITDGGFELIAQRNDELPGVTQERLLHKQNIDLDKALKDHANKHKMHSKDKDFENQIDNLFEIDKTLVLFTDLQHNLETEVEFIIEGEEYNNPYKDNVIDTRIDEITAQLVVNIEQMQTKMDGNDPNNNLQPADSTQSIIRQSSVKHLNNEGPSGNNLDANKEKHQHEEEMENFKNQVNLHTIQGKIKQLHEMDPMKMSIGQIGNLSESTQVFPGERDGQGTSQALRKRHELIVDQFDEFVSFSL